MWERLSQKSEEYIFQPPKTHETYSCYFSQPEHSNTELPILQRFRQKKLVFTPGVLS